MLTRLLFVILFGLGISNTSKASELKGDANGDGSVNAADLVAVVNHIMGNYSGTFVMEDADANGDNSINAADIVAIVGVIQQNLAPNEVTITNEELQYEDLQTCDDEKE